MRYRSVVGRVPVWGAVALLLSGAMSMPAPSAAETTDVRALAEQIDALLAAEAYVDVEPALSEYLAISPDDARMQYNASCVYAQLGELETAETHLRLAMRHGFMQFSTMQRDPDLAPLRDRPVLQSMFAARDAADGIIAGRRNDHWLDELGGHYRVSYDRRRNVDFISALDDQSQQLAQQRIARVADDLAGFFEHELRHRITIVLLSEGDAAKVFGNKRVRGHYRHGRRELIVTNLGRSLQHELTHAFHHSHMDALHQQHPMWVQEGLGCLMEAYERDATGAFRFLPNDRQTSMTYLLETGGADSWSELINAGSARFRQDAMTLYPLCRSVMEFVDERDSVQAWYERYTTNYEHNPAGVSALAGSFDVALQVAESDWRDWVLGRSGAERVDARQTMTALTYRAPVRSQSGTDSEGRESGARIVIHLDSEPSEAQALYQQARPGVLAGAYAEVIPTLEQVIAIDPEHADARYDLALGYIRAGRIDAARQQWARLRALDTDLASMVAACLRSVAARE